MAVRAVAAAMLAAAAYVLAQAAWALITGRTRGRALRGDGVLSAAGAVLAAAALAGLALDTALGWWQADPVAASLIALFLFREGWRTLAQPVR
jgi:divalent metal cation (Fe/Co/Zn/Cd) transporter